MFFAAVMLNCNYFSNYLCLGNPNYIWVKHDFTGWIIALDFAHNKYPAIQAEADASSASVLNSILIGIPDGM